MMVNAKMILLAVADFSFFIWISFEFAWGTVYTYPPRVHFNSRSGAVTVEQFLLLPLETRIRRENQKACRNKYRDFVAVNQSLIAALEQRR